MACPSMRLPSPAARLRAMERDFSKIIGDMTAEPTDRYTPPSILLTPSAKERKSRSAVRPIEAPLLAGWV